jgi:hypothetical protein
MKVLYAWAAPGSRLFFSDGNVPGMNPELKSVFEIYKNMGQPVHYRELTKVKEIIGPWKLLEPGFQGLEDWVSVQKTASEEMKSAFGTGIVGAILAKE